MQIEIINPQIQTLIFTLFIAVAFLISLRKDTHPHILTISATNELKGLAILMVIFSHIGYFLDSSDKFLFPLSVAGGVGVNIFLFLSGFGLTVSALRSNQQIISFYLKRLKRIFVPMWFVLAIFLILDYVFLNQTYTLEFILKSILGYFPSADIYTAFNSPLWYFSLILFYYLVFPLLFFKKQPIISAFLILIFGYVILKTNVLVGVVDKDVLKLYKLHFLAFPIGIAFAVLQNSTHKLISIISGVNPYLKYILIAILMLSISYTAIHSGVGEEVKYEQFISLITMTSFLFIILLKNIKSKLLIWLGIYSYEIYLLQWPILYRYDFLYKYLPAYLATILYLGLFLAIGYLMNRLIDLFVLKRRIQ